MKIAISSQGDDLKSQMDPRFGRAKQFIIYDTESKEFTKVDNVQNLQATQGAGIQSAKNVIDAGAEALISGNVGPKAFTTLKSADVKIYLADSGTIEQVIDKYMNNTLNEVDSANVEGHW